jgi:hypothetical protein
MIYICTMKKFIDITSLKYQEAFRFKGGIRSYWAIGFCDDCENFEYCDINNKKYKVSALKENLVKKITE